MPNEYWIITVGGGYGSFMFFGSAQEAEDLRAHKARWEGACAKLRPATQQEIDAINSKP